jgi:tRNA pseudouridine13 synthase
MKLKRLPEDFQVEELPSVLPGGRGRFTLYRLTKRGLGTLEAIEAIVRRWNLSRAQIAYGGLKDRHSVSVQYLSILDGPAQALRQTNFELEPVGGLPHPYGPRHFAGNRFSVVVRDLTATQAEEAVRAVSEAKRDGLPNYFDDQRFGSVGSGGEFIARAWLLGEYERALRLAIAEPNPFDRPDTKAEKAILREHWGHWKDAKGRLGRSHARSLVTYLADHPTDFRGAFARMRRDLRSLFFSAYQSHLWNLLLARLIDRCTRPDQRVAVRFKVATLPMPRNLEPAQLAELAGWHLPLPSCRTKLPPEGLLREIAIDLMADQGLAWEDLRVKHLKDLFFSKATRAALFSPATLGQAIDSDELYPGRRKLRLNFELPKGSYATILVKRIIQTGGEAEDAGDGAEPEEEQMMEED